MSEVLNPNLLMMPLIRARDSEKFQRRMSDMREPFTKYRGNSDEGSYESMSQRIAFSDMLRNSRAARGFSSLSRRKAVKQFTDTV